ncbi:Uncharacterised protein [Mycobacteroides abscessus subsp. abscessus]|nr:Uncharacterised protein [Mycobacteroides abscessus subsp. abscessus]
MANHGASQLKLVCAVNLLQFNRNASLDARPRTPGPSIQGRNQTQAPKHGGIAHG